MTTMEDIKAKDTAAVVSNPNKKLEGIKFTSEIRQIMKEILSSTSSEKAEERKDDYFFSREESRRMIQEQLDRKVKGAGFCLPIQAIKAVKSLLCTEDKKLKKNFEKALSSSTLVFTPPPHKDVTDEERAYKKRLERLRMKAEERKYMNLTSNITMEKQDDVTTKSMTYAASVGLNMIVAPLSFGVFMYFFSGQLFSFLTDDDNIEEGHFDQTRRQQENKIDIRRTIIGVVSGVIMLFIEMILFVIRSHEFDASLRKKAKKKKLEPFGHYVKDMPRKH